MFGCAIAFLIGTAFTTGLTNLLFTILFGIYVFQIVLGTVYPNLILPLISLEAWRKHLQTFSNTEAHLPLWMDVSAYGVLLAGIHLAPNLDYKEVFFFVLLIASVSDLYTRKIAVAYK
jgi:hypothetical protein